MPELLDRVAVVTGATGVVGAAVAQRFAEEGARLVLVDDDEAALARVRETLRRPAASVESLPADLSSESQTAPLLSRTLARFGQIDILVNAMGMQGRREDMGASTSSSTMREEASAQRD